ncbi:hypothetical protein BGZ96_002878, partial [Linnemannia gamsii]
SVRSDDAPRQGGQTQGIFLDNHVVNIGGQAQNPPQAAAPNGQNAPDQNQNPDPQGGAAVQPPAPA